MNGFFRHERHTRSWGEIAADFFMTLRENVNEAVREQQIRMARKIAAMVMLSIGAIFFLVGLSIFVGMLINQTTWSGYLVVGALLLIVGMLLPKK